MMELLCPAGSRESLSAAVENGADSVYMGFGAFNARRSAANFDGEAMYEAVGYCHERGVKAYIVLNTLVLDREMQSALDHAADAAWAGADAVIVQDIGLLSLMRGRLDGMQLHASTQMGIHTPEGARLAAGMGLSRAVLARETTLERIADISAAADIELEAFAHGAMCMSFSGACLMSSMAGERSGNRGTCAQPCRKIMNLAGQRGGDDRALSLADLSMIDHLGDMERAGVRCIKIEGRMKRAEYVAVVTRAYRLALDGADAGTIEREKRRMLDMFDRGGGCTGYYYGDGESTGHTARSEMPRQLMEEAAASYSQQKRKLGADIRAEFRPGESARLRMSAGGVSAECTGETVGAAERPQNRERYAAQLMKLGGTPFAAGECSLIMDEGAFLPMSAINALRRDCAAKLALKLHARRERPDLGACAQRAAAAEHTLLLVTASTVEQAAAAFEAGADEVALQPCEYTAKMFEPLEGYRRGGKKLLMSLPVVTMGRRIRSSIRELAASGLTDGAIAGSIWQYELISGLPLKIAGPASNAFNSYTLKAYRELGFDRVVLSPELTRPQLRDMAGMGTVIGIYGRAEIMQLRHCPVRERRGCGNCRGFAGELVDEAGRRFPVFGTTGRDCTARLLNCLPTDIIDLFGQLPAPEAVQLVFYDEDCGTVRERTGAAREALRGGTPRPNEHATRGHWSRAVD